MSDDALLIKYMEHVRSMEGTDFSEYVGPIDFSPEEIARIHEAHIRADEMYEAKERSRVRRDLADVIMGVTPLATPVMDMGPNSQDPEYWSRRQALKDKKADIE